MNKTNSDISSFVLSFGVNDNKNVELESIILSLLPCTSLMLT